MHLTVSNYTITTALGQGINSNWQALRDGSTGLKPCDFYDITDLPTWIGKVPGIEDVVLPATLRKFDCRNNQLALLSLEQDNFLSKVDSVIKKHSAERVGVFIGTSTSGIFQTEKAYRQSNQFSELPDWYHYAETQNIGSIAEFVRSYIGAKGPAYAISTACSSSAKVFATAHRAIQTGLCDAAIVGGVDSLCLTTLYGFHSLQLVSDEICRPADAQRKGLSIGEAAGFAVLETDTQNGDLFLRGYGESSDAYHMSSPHPDGHGAFSAMNDALTRAKLKPDDIDYINLHGTATLANDLAESRAIHRLFGNALPCSSTKGYTGHTLGAAGIVEAVFSLLCIKNNHLPPSVNTRQVDPEISININTEGRNSPVKNVLSNSFGFGGSNCSLIFGETHDQAVY